MTAAFPAHVRKQSSRTIGEYGLRGYLLRNTPRPLPGGGGGGNIERWHFFWEAGSAQG
jgi:hypothetical protein